MKKIIISLILVFMLAFPASAGDKYGIFVDIGTGRKYQVKQVSMDSDKNLSLTANLLWSAANVYYIGDAVNVAKRLYTTDLANASLANVVTIAELDECVGLYVYPDQANIITEVMLKCVNSATDEYALTYESTTGDFEWTEIPGIAWTDLDDIPDGSAYKKIVFYQIDASNRLYYLDDGTNTATVQQIAQAIANYVILGETSTTAYRGDRGKTAFDHVSSDGSSHADVVTNSGKTTESTTVKSPLALSTYNITIAQAGAAADGYLSSADWNTFNGHAADQNLWETIATDGTSVAANTTTDTLTLAGGGINVTSQAGDTITITGTEVDGSITNELNIITCPDANATAGTAITFADTGIMAITESADTITFDATEAQNVFETITGITNNVVADTTTDSLTLTGAGILTIVGTTATDTITFTATEVDGSTTNEINTITADDAGTTSGLAITLAGGGINATTRAGDTITVTATEVDGSITNELQDLWDVIAGDTGSTTADSNTDTLTIAGGGIATTAVVGDTLTVTATEAQPIFKTIATDGTSAVADATDDTLTLSGAGIVVTSESADTITITGTEADTLSTVCGRGNTYTGDMTITGNITATAMIQAEDLYTTDDLRVLHEIQDSAGANGVTVAQLKSTYDVSHAQNTDTDLDATFEAAFVKKADTVNVLSDITSTGANIEDAVTKKHTQGTDTTLGTMTADINMNSSYQVVGLQAPAASGEAIRQTAAITEATLTQAIANYTADDTAYNATSWDTNTDAATKNAIRDKVETMDTAIGLNTAKDTNVSTTLSAGTVNATTYGITSDGGIDDIVLPEADTTNAGLLGADKWDEIVANSLKTTNATHTGDVTGATALTIAANAILNTMIGADEVYDVDVNWGAGANQIDIDDVPDSSTYKRILAAVAAGDMIYCIDGSAWGIISKGTDNQQLKMDGNYPNWETITAGNVDFATAAVLGTI